MVMEIKKGEGRDSKQGSGLFSLGQFVATRGALSAMEATGESATQFLSRHVAGDWGCLCDEDKQANQEALEEGSQLLSAYKLSSGVKIWIITEWNRSVTTVLLPEEY